MSDLNEKLQKVVSEFRGMSERRKLRVNVIKSKVIRFSGETGYFEFEFEWRELRGR